jgi:hypothetical protein
MSAVMEPRLFLSEEIDMWNRSSALTPTQMATFISTMSAAIEEVYRRLAAGFTPEQLKAIDGDKLSRVAHNVIEQRLFPERAERQRRLGS